MKINELQKGLKYKNIDVALFINTSLYRMDPMIFYLTGLNLEYAIVAVPKKGSAFAIVPGFEYERARKSSRIKVFGVSKKQKILEVVKKKLGKVKVIGVHKDFITLNEFKAVKKAFSKKKYKDVSKKVLKLRAVKTDKEIALVKKSCQISSKLFKLVEKNFKNFKSEKDIAKFLFIKTTELGCKPAFNPIVASGNKAALPHALPDDKKLRKGFLVIDYGVKYKGYCSDITRTYYVGKPSDKEKKIYDIVLKVQKEVIKRCVVGMKSAKLFDFVYNRLGKYGKHFTHGLGHGIGIHIHELPNLKPDSKDVLKEGMIVTIEPGIYPKTYGIRIEDDVLVTKKGPIVLSQVGKLLRCF